MQPPRLGVADRSTFKLSITTPSADQTVKGSSDNPAGPDGYSEAQVWGAGAGCRCRMRRCGERVWGSGVGCRCEVQVWGAGVTCRYGEQV